VGATKPATPKDAADSGDKTLSAAEAAPPPKPAPQAKRPAVGVITVNIGMVGVQQSTAPKQTASIAMEQRFSLVGNNALW
jgi:hypothetical protein